MPAGWRPTWFRRSQKVRYLVRAATLPELSSLIARVRKIADGAALMTETKVTAQVISAVSNLLASTPLERAMQDNLERLGPPPFDDADRASAREFQATLTDEDIEAACRRAGIPVLPGTPLCDRIVPLDAKSGGGVGSTDVGDVSKLSGADDAGSRRDLCDRDAGIRRGCSPCHDQRPERSGTAIDHAVGSARSVPAAEQQSCES
jgi:metal-dependent amidase/aminoacylase/carboxypeptidase family protein